MFNKEYYVNYNIPINVIIFFVIYITACNLNN